MSHTVRVPFGKVDTNKKSAVFIAIYVQNISPWRYFKDEIMHKSCPAMIMIDRWDGRMGFPGGTLESHEPLTQALVREVKEEIGIQVKPQKVKEIVSHENQKIITHLYGLEVQEVEFLHIYYHILNNFSRSILHHAYEDGNDESHFMSEITGIKIVPIIEHEKKGINRFLENAFAGSSKYDLHVLLEEIFHYTLINK